MFMVVGILNWVATHFYLYWTVNEFDSLVHFMGGVLVALFFLWLYFHSGFFEPKKRNFTEYLKVSMLAILFVGVLWEAYELLIGEAKFAGEEYAYDTILDLIMDFLGAIVGCFYGYLKELKITR
jgi:hypothetical protein